MKVVFLVFALSLNAHSLLDIVLNCIILFIRSDCILYPNFLFVPPLFRRVIHAVSIISLPSFLIPCIANTYMPINNAFFVFVHLFLYFSPLCIAQFIALFSLCCTYSLCWGRLRRLSVFFLGGTITSSFACATSSLSFQPKILSSWINFLYVTLITCPFIRFSLVISLNLFRIFLFIRVQSLFMQM